MPAVSATVLAQGTYNPPQFGNQTSNEGINAGRFILYPAITFNYAHDDNLFYQADDIPGLEPVATGRVEVVPRIVVDLPLSRSRLRLQYSPFYRSYLSGDVEQGSKWSHFFNFEASILMADVFTVALRDHYVRGYQEVQEFDPGGETRFNATGFTLHEPSAEFSLDAGVRHRFSFIPRFSKLTFDQGEEIALITDTGQEVAPVQTFNDYERRGYEGRYTFKVSPETQVFAYTLSDYTQQDRLQTFYGTVDVDQRTTGLGLQRLAGGVITTGGSIGWEQMNFTGGGGGDYAGPAADINVGLTPSDVLRFDLMFRRSAFQSFYVNNNYYINLEGRLRTIRQFGRTAFWALGLTLAQNDYGDATDVTMQPNNVPSDDTDNDGNIDLFESFAPSQGVVRKDRAAAIDLSTGWRLRPTMRFTVGYNHQRRDSNVVQELDPDGPTGPLAPEFVETYDYIDNRVYVTLEMGFL